jgi:Ulp1 family protease
MTTTTRSKKLTAEESTLYRRIIYETNHVGVLVTIGDISLYLRDLMTLVDDWLNDEIINSYASLLRTSHVFFHLL